MLKRGQTYRQVYDAFEWQIPEFYNIGIDICDKWAQQRSRLALMIFISARYKRASASLASRLRSHMV